MTLRLDYVLSGAEAPDGIVIEMEYLPTLSVNSYRTRNGIIRSEVQRWRDQLAWMVKMLPSTYNITFRPPVKVRIDGVFKNKRSMPDGDNLLKICGDSIALGLNINDKNFVYETRPFTVDKKRQPTIIITISNS